MDDALLIGHILAAVVFIGPVTVATALFPALAAQNGQAPAARILHRITRVYGVLALLVPALGFAIAMREDLLDAPWVGISMGLTVVAALLLWAIVNDQTRALTAPPPPKRLAVVSGLFSAVWIAILVLMVVQPG